ncbi:hypothetical protein V8C86DRAFT_3030721 [Haematococcus lacustris]
MRVDDPISEAEEEEQQQGKAPAKQKARQGGTPKTPSRRLDPAQHHTPTRVGGGGAAAPVPAPQPGSAGRQLNQQPRVKFGLDYPIPNVGHGELALQPLPGEVEDWWWPVVYEAIQGYMIQDWVAKYGRKLPPAWTFATGDKKVKEAVQQQRTQWSRFKKDAGLAGKTQQVSKPVEKETAKWWSQLGCLRKQFGAQWRHEQWKDNLAVVHHLRDHGVLPELLPASWVVGSVPVDMEGDPAPLATPALDTWTPFLRDDLQRVAGDVASTAGIQMVSRLPWRLPQSSGKTEVRANKKTILCNTEQHNVSAHALPSSLPSSSPYCTFLLHIVLLPPPLPPITSPSFAPVSGESTVTAYKEPARRIAQNGAPRRKREWLLVATGAVARSSSSSGQAAQRRICSRERVLGVMTKSWCIVRLAAAGMREMGVGVDFMESMRCHVPSLHVMAMLWPGLLHRNVCVPYWQARFPRLLAVQSLGWFSVIQGVDLTRGAVPGLLIVPVDWARVGFDIPSG